MSQNFKKTKTQHNKQTTKQKTKPITKRQKDQRQKTKTKKRVLYCDVRAVSHSCDVFYCNSFCQFNSLQPNFKNPPEARAPSTQPTQIFDHPWCCRRALRVLQEITKLLRIRPKSMAHHNYQSLPDVPSSITYCA